jgi:TRAP-type C4-dicarboxylate transport system permease small subunit
VRVQVTDDPHEEALAWVALIATTLLVTAIVFLITGAKCWGFGKSAYCRTINAPGLATTPTGIAIELVLFGLPPLVAVCGVDGSLSGRSPSLGVATSFCAAIIALSAVLLVLAHAQSMVAD